MKTFKSTFSRWFAVTLVATVLLSSSCTPTVAPETAVQPTVTLTIEVEPTVEPTPEVLSTEVPPAEITPEPAAVEPLEAFRIELQNEVVNLDIDWLLANSSDPLGVGPYRSEWSLYDAQSTENFLRSFLPETAQIGFSDLNLDYGRLLDGQDPYMMLGPEANVALVLHSTGWGNEGFDEVIFFITEPEADQFEIGALLYAPFGFLPMADDVPLTHETRIPGGVIYQTPEGTWRVEADGNSTLLTSRTNLLISPDGTKGVTIEGGNFLLANLADQTERVTEMDALLSGLVQWGNSDILFAGVYLTLEEADGPNNGHLAQIDLESGEIIILDEARLMASAPALSPDGTMVAYASTMQSADDRETARLLNLTTGENSALDPALFMGSSISQEQGAFLTSPAWSADGQQMVWMVGTGDTLRPVLFDLNNSTVVDMAHFDPARMGGAPLAGVMSPNGQNLALPANVNHPAKTGLYLYNIFNTEPLYIAQYGGQPYWLNDSTLLFNSMDYQGYTLVETYNIDTGIRARAQLPDWSMVVQVIN